MKKMLLLIFLIVGILLSCSLVWGADWKLHGANDSGIFYYDAKSITHPSKDIVRVWTKTVYTEKGIKEAIAKLGKECENLYKTIGLMEINCRDKTRRLLSATYYTKDGAVIWTGDEPGAEWGFIRPETNMERLYKIVCK